MMHHTLAVVLLLVTFSDETNKGTGCTEGQFTRASAAVWVGPAPALGMHRGFALLLLR